MSLLDTASLIVTPNGYKEGKLYSVIPSDGSGDMSVTRATTATRVNSAGLVELVPYNLLEYSEQLENVYWTKVGSSVTANSATAPNGTLTADTIAFSSGGYFGKILTSSGVHSYSVYAKYIGTQWLYVQNYNGNDFGAWFDIQNGVVGTIESGVTASIEQAENGFYRCTITMNASSGSSSYWVFFNTTGNGSFSRTGSTYFWGTQLVEGSTAKDYQKTETRLNIPRLDYSNGTCPSLLVEPQRTNVCVYSNDLTGWINQIYNTTLTRIQTGGPDGNAFDRLVTTGSGNQGRYVQTSFLTGSNAIYSVYLRGSGTADIAIYNAGQSSLDTITLTSEWTRYETKITSGTSGYIDWSIFSFGGSTIDVAFSQMEFGNYSTSYIPTTSASVTRNADVISKTGISSLIGQTEGVIFADFYNYANNSTTTGCPISIANGGFYGNAVYIEQYLGNWYAVIWNGTTQQFISSPLSLSEGRHKLAVAYKANDIVFYADGVLVDSDTSASIPTCDGAYIGAVGTSTTPEQLAVNAVALWKTRLTNTQLAQLTSI